MRRFGSTRSIHTASGNSSALRTKLRPGHRNRFLAICWVMVEPPRCLADVVGLLQRLAHGAEIDAVVAAEGAVLGDR